MASYMVTYSGQSYDGVERTKTIQVSFDYNDKDNFVVRFLDVLYNFYIKDTLYAVTKPTLVILFLMEIK